MYNDIIGILGGMGSEATINLFENILKSFPIDKEWDRPRIIIDNYCTMPSRVRACLYDENKNELIKKMAKAILALINLAENGAKTHVIVCCNTAHMFLPQIYEIIPEAIENIIDIVDICLCNIDANSNVSLLASEGTLQTKIFEKYAEKYNITILPLKEKYYSTLRSIIEDIKQKNISKKTKNNFLQLIDTLNSEQIILGCTELPVLLEHLELDKRYIFHDPLKYAICYVKDIIK